MLHFLFNQNFLKSKNMNNEWFECKVKYERTLDDGKVKKVTEPYLVDALSFTEAEKRVIEERTPYMMGEFQVSDIKRARLAELFESDLESADKFYKAKLTFITLDEKTGAEKKSSHMVLVQAGDFESAVKRLKKGMKDSMSDYVISAMTETPILDIYHYKPLVLADE
jgi:hypothetical protein